MKRKAIAIISRNHVLIRVLPSRQRMEFSEATPVISANCLASADLPPPVLPNTATFLIVQSKFALQRTQRIMNVNLQHHARQELPMTTETITPLRQRMIEDMNARKLCAHTQPVPYPQLQAVGCISELLAGSAVTFRRAARRRDFVPRRLSAPAAGARN